LRDTFFSGLISIKQKRKQSHPNALQRSEGEIT
jgi:hypothetical protein